MQRVFVCSRQKRTQRVTLGRARTILKFRYIEIVLDWFGESVDPMAFCVVFNRRSVFPGPPPQPSRELVVARSASLSGQPPCAKHGAFIAKIGLHTPEKMR